MKTGGRRRVPDTHRDFAKGMRADSTRAESILWQALRNKQIDGFKFKRQVPIENYIVDFICFERRLIIEVDGSQHAESVRDSLRDTTLAKAGFKTLRFWNDEVVKNLDGVCREIILELKNTGE